MNRKTIKVILAIFIALSLNVCIYVFVHTKSVEDVNLSLNFEISTGDSAEVQLFHCKMNEDFSEENSFRKDYASALNKEVIGFKVDDEDTNFRLDFDGQNKDVYISRVFYSANGIEEDVVNVFNDVALNDIAQLNDENEQVHVMVEGNDPYIVFHCSPEKIIDQIIIKHERNERILKIIFCILIDLLLVIIFRHFWTFCEVPLEVVRNKKLVWSLAKNDFKTKYAGSYLGIVWAFVQPVVTVVVYWFVFQIGLKAGKTCDYPFILFLMSGLVPWFFFSDALTGGMNSMIEYNYLVKKVVFKISILPFVKNLSASFVHAFFVTLVGTISILYGYSLDLASLQIFYYLICNFVFSLGLSYLAAAIVCFFRDLSQIVNIILQVGMWLTPIMWDAEATLPPVVNTIFKLNPMYYIVDGYRDALLAKVWFWEKMPWTITFWIIVIFIFGAGMAVFRKLRVHFADVL